VLPIPICRRRREESLIENPQSAFANPKLNESRYLDSYKNGVLNKEGGKQGTDFSDFMLSLLKPTAAVLVLVY